MPKTPLHTAAQSGNMQQVAALLRDRAPVTCWDKVRTRRCRAWLALESFAQLAADLWGRMDGLRSIMPAGAITWTSRTSLCAGARMLTRRTRYSSHVSRCLHALRL